MKTVIKNLSIVVGLTVLGIILTGQAAAQGTINTLYNFTATKSGPIGGGITGGGQSNSDGADPGSTLVLWDNTLYGTTGSGGLGGRGAIFSITTDSLVFNNLHSFLPLRGSSTNSEGCYPYAGLTWSANSLYGTAEGGGTNGNGTLFSMNLDGSDFAVIHTFLPSPVNGGGVHTNADGTKPYGGLLIWNNTLYGTASQGGLNGDGTVFSVGADGTGFMPLHYFMNADGNNPGALVAAGQDLIYGMTLFGGSGGNGTVFGLNTNGPGFSDLYGFGNSDGAAPIGGLTLVGTNLYGVAQLGGPLQRGSIFVVGTNGLNFSTLHAFSAPINNTNSDGLYPGEEEVLAVSGNGSVLYGTTQAGGVYGHGTLFSINTDGTGFTTLYSFSAGDTNTLFVQTNSDGISPGGGLTLGPGNVLYGTASQGGLNGKGTVFSFTITPPLVVSITVSGGNEILSWPANYPNSYLQYSTDLTDWNFIPVAPSVVNGQYEVVNPIPADTLFFRVVQFVE